MNNAFIQNEIQIASKLPFLEKIELEDSLSCCCIIQSFFKVEAPAKGYSPGINSVERVIILISTEYPLQCPEVYVRLDFPTVPHQNIRKIQNQDYKSICFSRISTDDWWSGKVLADLFYTIKAWLDDAAAESLVKEDDPFEPLIADFSLPIVELDVSYAKKESSKYNGLWVTEAHSVDVDGEIKYKVLHKGDSSLFPTLVWHQPIEQNFAWSKRPSSLSEILELCSNLGMDKERIQYWHKKYAPKWKSNFLFVLGVKRPKTVLGRPDVEEWVAFDVKNENAVKTHLVRESFNVSLAKRVSGFNVIEQKTAVTIGAGSFGSCVLDSLVRSGVFKAKIVDYDRLHPHNLSRHVLTSSSIGKFKSVALAEVYNEMFCEKRCTAYTDSFLHMKNDSLESLFKDADLIIDCSASISVQRHLADMHFIECPIFSAYQINDGETTLAHYTVSNSKIPISFVETAAISAWRKELSILNWMSESASTVDVGGGCRSYSATIPLFLVQQGASFFVSKVFSLFNSSDSPHRNCSHSFMFTNTNIEKSSKHISFDTAFFKSGNWSVYVETQVIEKIKVASAKYGSLETGGVLFGSIDRQRSKIFITGSYETEASKKSCSFTRVIGERKYELIKLEKVTAGVIHYVGEWHSHPAGNSCLMSATDRKTMCQIAKALEQDRIPAICAISNGNEIMLHVIEETINDQL